VIGRVQEPGPVPAVIGGAAGNVPAVPMLGQTAHAYGVGSLAVPVWVSLTVPLAMLGLVLVTAGAISHPPPVIAIRSPGKETQ
jgi:hypothetical protein